MALRGEEREAHAAADEQPVDLGQQRLDDRQLVADLRAAEDDHVGPVRVAGQPGEHLELAGDQPAGRVRQPLGDVDDRGVLAVHGAERVVDVERRRGRPAGRRARRARRRPSTSRPPRSGRSPAGGRRRRRARRPWPGRRRPRRRPPAAPATPSSSPSRAATGAREYCGSGAPLGRPRWAATITRAPASRSACSVGRLARIRPSSVIAPVLLVQRDVQVGAHEHAPPGDALGDEVVDGTHQSDLPTSVVRSTRRLE